MKQIELTEEHKSKLLEMWNLLFPDIKLFEIDKDGYILFLPIIPSDNAAIHWFEFCITQLATVIYNKGDYYKNYVTITQFRGYLCQDVEHPIDYLYEQFKKINDEKSN